jgi:signal transduction histidine kinase
VRSLARGTYPRVLTEEGLVAARELAARDAPIHTTVVAESLRRCTPEIETAVPLLLGGPPERVRHAGGAAVGISLGEREDTLWLEVIDDGAGFDPGAVSAGAGLRNMEDRVAAVGGHLSISSAPRRGTRITGTIPLAGARTA